ncbi:hypothetical protein Tco_0134479 [Tanacetum coccineum]
MAPAKAERSKGIEFLSEAALLEEAHDDENDQQSDDERTESNDDKSADLNKTDDEEETHDDKFLKDTELEGEGKDDEEMTDAGHVDAEHENVNQEVAGDQVKDDAQATVTAAPATQKTEIKVQHEDPSIQTSPLFTIHVLVISETSSTPVTTIPLPIPSFIPLPQQSTLIPTPTTTEATTSTTDVPDSETLSAIHLRVSNLEKEVKELKNVNHSSALLATIKPEVLTVVNEYLRTSLDDALCKVL